jgi:hypothetical protein
MAFYNDVTFLSMVSLIVIVGLGFVILWFISIQRHSIEDTNDDIPVAELV